MEKLITKKVVAYITYQDSMLIFRHTQFPEAGIQVPAGTVEAGESVEAAVLREAWEESGLEDLEICNYLGMDELDLSEFGMHGIDQRHFYHLARRKRPPKRWSHIEKHPSGGDQDTIEFELFWVKFPDEVPELSGGQDAMLARLVLPDRSADS
jgi:8-oxo-dGTP pyrophosphatase MutT (NUDIX family)